MSKPLAIVIVLLLALGVSLFAYGVIVMADEGVTAKAIAFQLLGALCLIYDPQGNRP